jgi:hypothetical protein
MEAIRHLPRMQKLTLVAVVAILTAVPAVVSRIGTQSTLRVGLRLVPDVAHAPGEPLPYVRMVFRTQIEPVVLSLSRLSGSTIDLRSFRSISINSGGSGPNAGVRLEAASATPTRGLGMLKLLASQIASASSAASHQWLKLGLMLSRYNLELRRPGLPPRVRHRILDDRLFVSTALRGQPPAGPLEAGSVTSSANGLVAQIYAHLPGNPGRPSTPWAAVSGFILGLALVGTWIVFAAFDRRRSHPAMGARRWTS